MPSAAPRMVPCTNTRVLHKYFLSRRENNAVGSRAFSISTPGPRAELTTGRTAMSGGPPTAPSGVLPSSDPDVTPRRGTSLDRVVPRHLCMVWSFQTCQQEGSMSTTATPVFPKLTETTKGRQHWGRPALQPGRKRGAPSTWQDLGVSLLSSVLVGQLKGGRERALRRPHLPQLGAQWVPHRPGPRTW